MCRYENSGTQIGEFAGHPPNGRSFVSLRLDWVHVEDGLVVEPWALLDLDDMGQQLGWENDPS
jgi:predicted ester cyclase